MWHCVLPRLPNAIHWLIMYKGRYGEEDCTGQEPHSSALGACEQGRFLPLSTESEPDQTQPGLRK